MAVVGDGPGGLILEEFEALALETGAWLWGTLQGAFNEEATLSQIVVDAVVGMVPLVGDVTAVRDLIAVTLGLADEEEKREDPWQWILLVVLLFALIPVIGGVIKGVGRLLHLFGRAAAKLANQSARLAKVAESAQDIVAFLNRVGLGNAEAWLKGLRFADHQAAVLATFQEMLTHVIDLLAVAKVKLLGYIPDAAIQRIDDLIAKLDVLRTEAARRIPEAIKTLDRTLREIQAYIRSGGETTSQLSRQGARAGTELLTYADEARLTAYPEAATSIRGGAAKNSPRAQDLPPNYTPADGHPDILGWRQGDPLRPDMAVYPNIATFSGPIRNEVLQEGRQVFRVFGPEGRTHGVTVHESFAAGSRPSSPNFWGLDQIPDNAETWRHGSGVLDEWNRDGFMVIGVLEEGASLPACTGRIAEQTAAKLPGQHLLGGDLQAMLQLPEDAQRSLNTLAAQVMDSGSVVSDVRLPSVPGVRWEIRPTGWTDVNGVYGYLSLPGPGSVTASRLSSREYAEKDEPLE